MIIVKHIFRMLPLPMLALAASWGVYQFQLIFAPQAVAIISAAAFELVYIGLTVADVASESRKRATVIAGSAVLVSIVYNSLSGLFHIRPELLMNKPLIFDIALAVLHGLPLALLAFFVADLLLHKSQEATQTTSELHALLHTPPAPMIVPQEVQRRPTAMLDSSDSALLALADSADSATKRVEAYALSHKVSIATAWRRYKKQPDSFDSEV